MPRRIKPKLMAVVVTMLLLVGLNPVNAGTSTDPILSAALSNLVARFGGTLTDYQVLVSRDIASGPLTFWTAKFLDRRDGEIRVVYRTADGVVGGPEVWQQALSKSTASLSAKSRKASAELLAAAAKSASTDLVAVAVWFAADTSAAVQRVVSAHPEGQWIGDRPDVADLSLQRLLRSELDDARASVYREAADQIARAIGSDGTIGYVSLLAPLAFVDLKATALDRLAALPDVRSMGLESVAWHDSLASAGPFVHANWTTTSDDQGTGSRVGVIEYYNVREGTTGDLAGKVVAFHSMSGSTMYTPSGSFDHPTWVAGAIASQDATDKGIAPGALIVSSGAGGGVAGLARDRDVISAADWAATTGASDIINMSVNMDSTTGRDEARAYFDSLGGGESYRTVVASSGNYGSGVDAGWLVSSPGVGWNVLTVGGVNDGTGDLWYSSSCPCGAQYQERSGVYYNAHGDFNKPDVSAPAVSVRTANGLSASGTSVATPIVSGIAAQLFALDPTFVSWPEGIRAVIMASAARRSPLPGGGTSTEHEGVGTADAAYAHRVESNGSWGGWTKGTMTSTTPISKTFSVATGKRVRAVLTWDSHTTGTIFNKTDTLTADLDLYATYPGGSASSITYDNSSEFVSFTASAAGTVTLSIHAPRFDRGSEFWALAWYVY